MVNAKRLRIPIDPGGRRGLPLGYLTAKYPTAEIRNTLVTDDAEAMRTAPTAPVILAETPCSCRGWVKVWT